MAVAALDAEHADTFARLLPGSSPYPGLAVDDDLMWRYLHRLAVLGRCTADHLTLAAKADPSWDGQLRALTVRAAFPSDTAKREGWGIAVDETRSVAERRAAMAGIRQHHQEHLQAGYTELYYDSLAEIWASQEAEFSIAFTRLLYPQIAIDPAHVVAETDRVLADADTPAELAAILRDEQAHLVRAEAARACDRRMSSVGLLGSTRRAAEA